MRTQLVAARSVAEAVLADLVDGRIRTPRQPGRRVAGPREENLLEAAKLLAAKHGNGLRVEAGDLRGPGRPLYGRRRPPRPAG
jgi:hypothetical protein